MNPSHSITSSRRSSRTMVPASLMYWKDWEQVIRRNRR